MLARFVVQASLAGAWAVSRSLVLRAALAQAVVWPEQRIERVSSSVAPRVVSVFWALLVPVASEAMALPSGLLAYSGLVSLVPQTRAGVA